MRKCCVIILILAYVLPASVADWPQFRGPDGQGHAEASSIPLQWSETQNVRWKTRIPGEGHSSPVIRGDQIWMTTSTEDGKSLRAVCVERATGRLLHDVEVLRPAEVGAKHPENGFASPTPVLDNDRVFVHFGGHGTACLDRDGNILWESTKLQFAGVQGSASSPILHGDLLILTCDGNDSQFVAALDKQSGDVRWKQPREHYAARATENSFFRMAYSTPLVARIGDVDQLVSTAADHVAAYDVLTGKEIWWMPYEGCSQVARPLFGYGMFFVVGTVTLDHHCIYAIRPGKGRTDPHAVVWKRPQGVGHVPSPILVGQQIYFVHDDGIVTCIDALTGKQHWRERLGGRYRASPIEVQGRICFSSVQGRTTVLSAGTEFQSLATNDLDGSFLASPAVAGNAIFLRSGAHLYRIDGEDTERQ